MSDQREAARRLLEALVSTYSPSGREANAAERLVDELERLGLDAHRDEVGNVHAEHPSAEPQAPQVVLLGHIDTVPGELPVRWEGQTLHGRGAVDAKGPLAAHALALARLPEETRVAVRLVAAVGEETTSRGARHVRSTLDPPDALVIAEPTGARTIGLGYKGRVTGQLTAHAEPAHPGAPQPSAAEQLLDAIESLTRWTGNPERDVGIDERTLRIGELATEHGPEREVARAGFDLRVPGQPPEPETLRSAAGSQVELTIDEALAGVRGDPRGPVATALRGALRERGGKPRAAVKTGTSDWNVVASAWSCPAAAYGPGDPALDHTPHERIDLDEVLDAAEVLASALERFPEHIARLETA